MIFACTPSLDDKHAELETIRAAIRADGYPVSQDELEAWHGSVPEEDNAAPLHIDAIKTYQTLDPYCAELEAIDALLTGSSKTEPYPVDWIERAVGYMDTCKPAIDLLRATQARPSIHFDPISLSGRPDFQARPQLDGLLMRYAAVTDNEVALLESHNRMIRLGTAMLQTPVGWLQTSGGRYLGNASNTLVEVLNWRSLDETTLAQLQARYAEIDVRDAMVNTIVDAVCGLPSELDEHVTREGNLSDADWERTRLQLEIDILRMCEDLLDMTERDWPAIAEITTDRYDLYSKRPTQDSVAMFALALNAACRVYPRHAARCRIMVTTLAIERFRAQHGHIPEKLADLVPAYLDAVPRDPFDGQPLRYYKRDTEYEVYSIDHGEVPGVDAAGNRIHIPGTIDALIRRLD